MLIYYFSKKVEQCAAGFWATPHEGSGSKAPRHRLAHHFLSLFVHLLLLLFVVHLSQSSPLTVMLGHRLERI